MLRRIINIWGVYDPKLESTILQYLDVNNLYGWAMSQQLSTGGFRWVEVKPNEISKLVKSDKGYLLEADVSYLRELHDSHNDLPFMCESMKINGVEKLVPNLHDKRNYAIHIRALDQALAHGLIPEQIHRAIEFDQSAWMKPIQILTHNLEPKLQTILRKISSN